MKLLITITERDKGNVASKIIGKYKVDKQIVVLAEGTAPSEIMEFLSLGSSKKEVVFSLIAESDETAILKDLNQKFDFSKLKTGMALTLKLSSINKISYENLLKGISENEGESIMAKIRNNEINNETNNETNNKIEEEKAKITEETTDYIDENKELIIYICNAGYVQGAMDDARKAGAGGGTILHARSSAYGDKSSFFGIKIHPEKEMLLIVCTKEQRNTLMEAINKKHGNDSDARGIIFSLAVSKTLGVNFDKCMLNEMND